MDRGALSLVFSPAESTAALGLDGVKDLDFPAPTDLDANDGRELPKKQNQLALPGGETPSVVAVPLPAPAPVEVIVSHAVSEDAALAALDAEIAALEPADSAGEAKDLKAVVPSPALGPGQAWLAPEGDESAAYFQPATPTCLDRCVGDVSFVGRHRKLVSMVTAAYFAACATLFWNAGAYLSGRRATSMVATAVILSFGGFLYAAWLATTSWWYAWGDGAEQVRVILVNPMRNPLLNVFKTLAVGWFALPALLIIFLIPYGVLRLGYSAVNCTAKLPEKKRRPPTST
jgi:hypothetical protein